MHRPSRAQAHRRTRMYTLFANHHASCPRIATTHRYRSYPYYHNYYEPSLPPIPSGASCPLHALHALHVLPFTAPLLVTSVHLVTPQYTSLHRPVAPVVSSPAPVSVYLQRAPTDIPMCDEVGIMRTSMRSALASNPAARSPSGTFREYRSSRFVYCWM